MFLHLDFSEGLGRVGRGTFFYRGGWVLVLCVWLGCGSWGWAEDSSGVMLTYEQKRVLALKYRKQRAALFVYYRVGMTFLGAGVLLGVYPGLVIGGLGLGGASSNNGFLMALPLVGPFLVIGNAIGLGVVGPWLAFPVTLGIAQLMGLAMATASVVSLVVLRGRQRRIWRRPTRKPVPVLPGRGVVLYGTYVR